MQSKIQQRTLVQCPVAQASRRLSDFFRAHGNADGDTAQLALRVDARIPGLSTPVRLERSVIVTIAPHRREGAMTPEYNVAWAPTEEGPFPLFAGTIRVDATDDYNSFFLVLEGSYEPPLGAVGAAFDVLIGARIAAVCARNLLSRIGDETEALYLADEAKKTASLQGLVLPA